MKPATKWSAIVGPVMVIGLVLFLHEEAQREKGSAKSSAALPSAPDEAAPVRPNASASSSTLKSTTVLSADEKTKEAEAKDLGSHGIQEKPPLKMATQGGNFPQNAQPPVNGQAYPYGKSFVYKVESELKDTGNNKERINTISVTPADPNVPLVPFTQLQTNCPELANVNVPLILMFKDGNSPSEVQSGIPNYTVPQEILDAVGTCQFSGGPQTSFYTTYSPNKLADGFSVQKSKNQ